MLICLAASVARGRLERGVRLNIPEATALISSSVIEAARDGARLEEAVAAGRAALSADQVLPGVAAALDTVRVEAVFDDGTRLAVVNDPIPLTPGEPAPGEVIVADGPTPGPSSEDLVRIEVVNTGGVPISVTSHWHFFEANPRLRFDRAAAYGRRLAVPSGESVRFEPGETVRVDLVAIGGDRVLIGFAGLVDGPLDDPATRADALARVAEFGYLDSGVRQ